MRVKLVCILIALLVASSLSSALAQEEHYSLEWQRFLPGLSGTAVISTSDSGYLALGEDASYNSTTGEFYDAHPIVVKTDERGNLVWSKTIVYEEGGSRTRLSEVIEVNGGYILGGVIDTNQYPGSQHFCLIKINNKGDIVWKTVGTFERYQSYFEADALTATSDGGCFLVGAFRESTPSIPFIVITKVQASGQLEYSKALPVGHPLFPWLSGSVSWVTQTSDDGFLLLNNQGQSRPISPSSTSLLKIDPSGNVEWTQSFGGGGNYYHTTGECVVVLSDGYLIGGTGAPQHSWSGGIIIRTDLEGNMLWNRTYTETSTVSSALNSTQGGFLLIGAVADAPDSEKSHIWLWQTDALGEIQRQSELLEVNTYMFSGVSQLAPSQDGGVVFTGSFFYEGSRAISGSTSATNKFWIAKASMSGNGTAPGGSGFPVSEVALGAGITAVTVLTIALLLRHRKKRN